MPDQNPLWSVIQHYMDDPKHRYPPKVADLARETGISDQTLSKWKRRPTMPEAKFLLVFAQATGISYEVLLRAALEGRHYLPPRSILKMPDNFDAWLADSVDVREMRAGGGAQTVVIATDAEDRIITPKTQPQEQAGPPR